MRTAVEKTFDIVIGGAKIGANAMRGIHVIIKGLELGFHAMSVVINRVLQAIPESVDFVVNLAKQSINNYIIALNKLPNVAIPLLEQSTSAATTFFQNTTDIAKASMKQTRDELDNLLMKPLPGDVLQEWVNKVQETSQKAAEEIARTREAALGLNVNELPDPSEDPRIAYEQAAQNGIIGVLVNSLDVMDKVSKDAAQKRLETQTWFASESINAYSNMFGNISSLMQSENKRMFEIGKAAAVSQAVIDTIASAQAAYKSLAGVPVVGPALGAAAAGAAVLAGVARVGQINSTSFGQKSVPAGGGGGAVGATSAVAPQQSAPSQTMYVEGLNGDQLFSGTMVRSLVEKIDEYRKDGGAVVLV